MPAAIASGGADWSGRAGLRVAGFPRAVGPVAGIVSGSPNCPRLPHPRRKVWGGLGLRRMLWDRISLPRPPARSSGEAGCPGKPSSRPEPGRPAPGGSARPAAAEAPFAPRRSRWARVGCAPPGPRAPPAPTAPAAPASPPWEELGVGASQCWLIPRARRGVRPGPRVRGRGRAGGVLGGRRREG